MAQSHSEPVAYVRRSWPAAPEQLSVMRRALRGWLAAFSLDEPVISDLVLATDEAVANAVEHAYAGTEGGSVELVLWTEPGALYIEVIDQGIWRPPPEKRSTRGWGIRVMHSVVDSVLIRYGRRGTRVLLRYTFPENRDAPAESELCSPR